MAITSAELTNKLIELTGKSVVDVNLAAILLLLKSPEFCARALDDYLANKATAHIKKIVEVWIKRRKAFFCFANGSFDTTASVEFLYNLEVYDNYGTLGAVVNISESKSYMVMEPHQRESEEIAKLFHRFSNKLDKDQQKTLCRCMGWRLENMRSQATDFLLFDIISRAVRNGSTSLLVRMAQSLNDTI